MANGTHTIAARARDAAGNTNTSTGVTVTVNNPLATGLVLGYGFDELAGTTVTDSSTSHNEGALVGATRTTGGKYGGALSFNGTSNRVDVPDSASLDLTNAMTLEAWVKPTTVTGGWRTAILKERGAAGHVFALYASNGSVPTTETFVGDGYNGAHLRQPPCRSTPGATSPRPMTAPRCASTSTAPRSRAKRSAGRWRRPPARFTSAATRSGASTSPA